MSLLTLYQNETSNWFIGTVSQTTGQLTQQWVGPQMILTLYGSAAAGSSIVYIVNYLAADDSEKTALVIQNSVCKLENV